MVTLSPIRTEALTEPRSVGANARVRHILLITRFFPPLNVVSSLRMYQWAKYWAREGLRVTVLTTMKHWFSGPLDTDVPPLPQVQLVVEFLPKPLLRLLARRRRAARSVPARAVPTKCERNPAGWVRIKTWWRRRSMASRLLPQLEFYDFWVGKTARARERSSPKIRST
jgi:hypothetical protein